MTDTPALVVRPTQTEVHYKSHGDEGKQCQHCRWFVKEGDGGPYCHVIESIPVDIAPDGGCDRHEAKALLPAVDVSAPETKAASEPQFIDETSDVVFEMIDSGSKVVDPNPDKSALVRIWDGIAAKLKRDEPEQASGIKVYGDRWFAWWSNAYEDREKEFFPAKAIDAYIRRVDMGIVPYPELWVWHVPGSKHGQADWLGRIGNFAVASGTFDDTAAGRHAKAAYARRGQRYQMSHGFFYDVNRKKDGSYHQFNTFELTTIPAKAKAAANSFTDFQGADLMQTLTPDRRAELETLLGKEVADELIAKTEAKDKALTEMGVAYKDFAVVDDVNVETEAAKEAAASASKDFTQLVVDLVGDHAHVSTQIADAVKALVAYKQSTDKLIADQNSKITKLEEALDQRPRSASKDEATELTPERIQQMTEEVEKQSTTIDPFWNTKVTKLD